MENVYENFKGLTYDNVAESYGHIIVRSYQAIPKYWLSTSPNHRLILMNWTTGSGKTLGGLMTVLRNIKAKQMSELNGMFMKVNIDIPKVIVIGEWMTQSQMENELCRREFTLLSEVEWARINKLLNSKSSSDSELGQKLMSKYVKSLKKYIHFIGYQGLVSNLLPHYIRSGLQEINNMLNDFYADRLKVNTSFLESIRGSIIIVDEMQRLYSASGLNTFGFAIIYLVHHSSEFDLKFALMTGTLLNSSIVELTDVANICNVDGNSLLKREDYFSRIGSSGGLDLWKFNDGSESDLFEIIKPHFMYYSKSTKKTTYARIKGKNIILESTDSDIESYPKERLVGTVEIAEDMAVFGIEAKGEQLAQLLDSRDDSLLEDDQDQSSPSVKPSLYDVALPPKDSWSKFGISLARNGIFNGPFLERKNIENFSAIGAFIIDHSFSNALKNEKSVIYHQKIRGFGLLQYARILEINGFVKYGTLPTQNSICKNCGRRFVDHANPSKSCNSFQSIVFAVLYGDMDSRDRQKLVNEIYNSPLNLYGSLISILLISDVAYVGVSLLATNNMYILSPVSNISKLRQIQARVNRFKSHSALPPEKRFVNQYILGVCSNGTSSIHKNKILSYYKARYTSSIDIEKEINKLKINSLGDSLMKSPDKLVLSPEELRNGACLLYEDTVDTLRTISTKIQLNSKTNMWRLDQLTDRICDPRFALSFIDLRKVPHEFIVNALKRSPYIEMYRSNFSDDILVKNKTITDKISLPHFPEIPFEEIEVDHYKIIDDLKHLANNSDDKHKLLQIFKRAINILSGINDLSPMLDWEKYWQTIFTICGEYYSGDETDFLKNHISKNRSFEKMDGAYISGGRILLKTGEVKFMKFSFSMPTPYRDTNYVFKMENRNGFCQLFAYEFESLTSESNFEDLRRKGKGDGCMSSQSSKIYRAMGIDGSLKSQFVKCVPLIERLCEEQLANKNIGTFFFSPFQK